MPKKKDVDWSGWTLYYVGRGLELFGLIVVTLAMVNFFGTSQMRPMLGMTSVGSAFFVVGWLFSKNEPGRKR